MTPLTLVSSSTGRQRAEPHPPAPSREVAGLALRRATKEDAAEIHGLIVDHQMEGHLLPRSLADVGRAVERFVIACSGDRIVACGELAPLGLDVAEIRSLVVDRAARGQGVGEQMFTMLKRRAEALRFVRLCAFTHEPRYFIRLGFSIVPHTWVPEKISADCCACPQFRRCGQFGMLLDLAPAAGRAHPFG